MAAEEAGSEKLEAGWDGCSAGWRRGWAGAARSHAVASVRGAGVSRSGAAASGSGAAPTWRRPTNSGRRRAPPDTASSNAGDAAPAPGTRVAASESQEAQDELEGVAGGVGGGEAATEIGDVGVRAAEGRGAGVLWGSPGGGRASDCAGGGPRGAAGGGRVVHVEVGGIPRSGGSPRAALRTIGLAGGADAGRLLRRGEGACGWRGGRCRSESC
jgi:hypothetical protein